MKSNKPVIIMFHGLGGSPAELLYQTTFFKSKGFTVECPVLPGHCTSVDDLKNVDLKTLETFVFNFVADKLEKNTNVYISGLCLGAVLSLYCAIKFGEKIKAILPISTTLTYDGWDLPKFAKHLGLLKYMPFAHHYKVKESEPYGVKNLQIREWIRNSMASGKDVAHYSEIPLKSILMMNEIVSFVTKNLKKIKTPTIAFHAAEDEITSIKSVELLEKNLNSPVFEKVILENSYHLATIDNDRAEICRKGYAFINALAKNEIEASSALQIRAI